MEFYVFSVLNLKKSTTLRTYPRNGTDLSSCNARNFSCALFDNGKIKCWGAGESGQLGNGSTKNIGGAPNEIGASLPYIDLGKDFVAVSVTAGIRHACALANTGKVKCWGSNQFGALAIGSTDNRGGAPGQMGDNLPYANLGGTVIDIQNQEYHTCAIFDDGRLKCWGANDLGGIGLGARPNIGYYREDMGDNLPYVRLGTNVLAKAVYFGGLHACVVTQTNEVKCFGNNNSGQLGLGDKVSRGRDSKDMGDNLPFVNLQ